MSPPRDVCLYLNPGTRGRLESGRHGFLSKVISVLEAAGWRWRIAEDSAAARRASADDPGHAIFHMAEPTHPRAVTVRRVYHYPFWQIEGTARRWDWDVARDPFPAGEVNRKAADRFLGFWQQRLFGEGPMRARRDGLTYVALQGRLRDHRSFQSCAPMEMLEHVPAHRPGPILAALHPKEEYSSDDLQALEDLARRFPRLTVRTGGMEAALEVCDMVVTQNSSAAFNGYFFGKPAVLFAGIDFHHIASNVADLGVAEAFRQAEASRPDYAGYLHWFWQQRAINAGREDAEARIAQRLRRFGWDL
ncbi:hypothetical protein E0K89_006770 [Aquicoccus sp. SCR17]|nr:hypothetical protein [Carideicomes alvinocaridis]